MGLINKLAQIIEKSRQDYEAISSGDFSIIEKLGSDLEKDSCVMAVGDNALFMKYLLEKENMAGKIQTVYIDPPFFTKSKYDAVLHIEDGDKTSSVKYCAYDDIWEQGMESYLEMICLRLMLIKDLLSETGTLWVHLDWHADHYVKVLLDEIFGAERFVNEIVWTYKSGGSSKNHFSRKHDTILVYSKTRKYYFSPLKEKSYNRGFKPYRFKGVEEFQDEIGWYTMVYMKDVWNIDMVGRTSRERNGYATQKPEALIHRILQCSSKPGDICADFFSGSGTLAAVAEKMGRRWICCDNEPLAASCTINRVVKDCQNIEKNFNIKVLKDLKNSDSNISNVGGSALAAIYPDDEGGKYKFKLVSYMPSIDLDRIDEKDRDVLVDMDETRGLKTITRISADFNHIGNLHSPDWIHIMESQEDIADLEFCSDTKDPHIVLWDVFGNKVSAKIQYGMDE